MPKTILIVEDDEKLTIKLADILSAEGYEVETALDGEAGRDCAFGQRFDLIVLDIMLPGLDGVSLCRMIRKDDMNAVTPIIIISARGTEVDKIIALESGADDYMVKPPGLGEFLARVRVQLRPPPGDRAARSNVLESGGIRVDVEDMRVFVGEEQVQLTQKEFGLLVLLMKNPNAVLSRDFILANVWGEHYVVTDKDKRTVDVHIRWLREKIEDNPSSPKRISTVRGVGYRFEG